MYVMANYICDQCGKGFKRSKHPKRNIRFCGRSCFHAWRKENNVLTGCFQKGNKPWNKDLKGIHLSPESEFKKGQDPINKLPVGSVQIRRRKKDNNEHAYVKTAEPDKWGLRCYVEWEKRYGPVPKGLIIHHIDRNTLNDNLTNLSLESRATHMNEHRPEFEQKRKERATKAQNKRWKEYSKKKISQMN